MIAKDIDQTPYEDVDREALAVHPIVKMWEEVAPYLLSLNSSYQDSWYDNTH